MLQGNQLSADQNQGTDQNDSSFTGPYRHKGYKRALSALRNALQTESAVILKGVEGTGKTTLVTELISQYQHKGVPVVNLVQQLHKAPQLYAKLAEALEVPKQKKELINALRNTRNAGQFCLVVVDQEAINSSNEVADALKQLCLTSETTSGAIKLVVVRKDYLVIHTEQTPEADFHKWIDTEVVLDPLQTDDIEGYIYYLSAIRGKSATPYEIGTDFIMIERTEGRISRLKALLLPLIHKDVITRRDLVGNERNMRPLHSNRAGLFALGFAAVLGLGVAVNHFFLQDPHSTETVTKAHAVAEKEAPAQQIFAEPTKSAAVTPPSRPVSNAPIISQQLANTNAAELPLIDSSLENELPALTQETTPKQNAVVAQTPEPVQIESNPARIIRTKASVASQTEASTLPESTSPVAKNEVAERDEMLQLPPDQFQLAVKQKLNALETNLSDAIAENQKLKQELAEAQAIIQKISDAEQKAETKPDTHLGIGEVALSPETVATATPVASKLVGTVPSEAQIETVEQATQVIATSTETAAGRPRPAAVAEIIEAAAPTEALATTTSTTVQKQAPTTVATEKTATAVTNQVSAPKTEISSVLETSTPQQIASATLDQWQQAWQTKDVEQYINAYTDKFNGAFKTHKRWVSKRSKALTKHEWIKLSREPLTNIKHDGEQIVVDFWLRYESSNGYKDKTHKRITLERFGETWLIRKEQNLAVSPFF